MSIRVRKHSHSVDLMKMLLFRVSCEMDTYSKRIRLTRFRWKNVRCMKWNNKVLQQLLVLRRRCWASCWQTWTQCATFNINSRASFARKWYGLYEIIKMGLRNVDVSWALLLLLKLLGRNFKFTCWKIVARSGKRNPRACGYFFIWCVVIVYSNSCVPACLVINY